MTLFKKRFTPEEIARINEAIIVQDLAVRPDDREDSSGKTGVLEESAEGREPGSEEESSTEGILILDATCIPADVHYPTDTHLLFDAIRRALGLLKAWRGNLTPKREKLLGEAKQTHLNISKAKHPGKAQIRWGKKVLLSILKRCLSYPCQRKAQTTALEERTGATAADL